MGKWFLIAAVLILSLFSVSAQEACNASLGQNCGNTFECSCSSAQLCLPEREGSDSKGCYTPRCGDGFIDKDESQQTCCKDAGCPAGMVCDNASNQCVECSQDSDCRGLLCFQNRCVECITGKDCEGAAIWKNTGTCSQDNKYFLEEGELLAGVCKNYQCIGRVPTSREVLCENTFCQDDTCGCSPGFEACPALGKCAEIGVLKASMPCGCDFQCLSGYCSDSGSCIEPLNVVFSSQDRSLSTRQSSAVLLSVDNTLNKIVNVNIVLQVGDGAYISGIISGADCTGNQCKISRKLGERAREEVSIELSASESVKTWVEARVAYEIDGKQYAMKEGKKMEIEFIHCGNEMCEKGESSANCCVDCGCPLDKGYSVYSCVSNSCQEKTNTQKVIQHASMFLLFALILAAVILIIRAKHYYRYRKEEEEKEDRERSEEEEKQRALIRKAIIQYGKKKDIVASNAREAHNAIKNKFDFEFEREVFNEEFLALAEAAQERAKMVPGAFCTKCGAKIKDKARFCNRCGEKVRMVPEQ